MVDAIEACWKSLKCTACIILATLGIALWLISSANNWLTQLRTWKAACSSLMSSLIADDTRCMIIMQNMFLRRDSAVDAAERVASFGSNQESHTGYNLDLNCSQWPSESVSVLFVWFADFCGWRLWDNEHCRGDFLLCLLVKYEEERLSKHVLKSVLDHSAIRGCFDCRLVCLIAFMSCFYVSEQLWCLSLMTYMIAHLSSRLQAVISQKALLQAVNQMTDLVHISSLLKIPERKHFEGMVLKI